LATGVGDRPVPKLELMLARHNEILKNAAMKQVANRGGLNG